MAPDFPVYAVEKSMTLHGLIVANNNPRVDRRAGLPTSFTFRSLRAGYNRCIPKTPSVPKALCHNVTWALEETFEGGVFGRHKCASDRQNRS